MRDPSLASPHSRTQVQAEHSHGRRTRFTLGPEASSEEDSTADLAEAIGAQSHAQPAKKNGIGPEQNRMTTVTAETTVAPDSATIPQGPPQTLQGHQSDSSPKNLEQRRSSLAERDLWRVRHGWEDQYSSNDYLALLNSVPMAPPASTPPRLMES